MEGDKEAKSYTEAIRVVYVGYLSRILSPVLFCKKSGNKNN